MASVAILGGGVAGLTAAHELIDRGFVVTVYEKTGAYGGKAQSYLKPNSAMPPLKDLPGEHGFRFFPGFYQHIPDTMKRIPFPGNPNGVFDNLVNASQTGIAQEGKPLFTFLNHQPQSVEDWILVLRDWFGAPELGLTPGEVTFFVARMLKIMSMCDKRRFAKLEKIDWWSFIDAKNCSIAYRNLLARGLTRSLVAMRAEEGNSRTIGFILIQMMMSMTSQSGSMDRVLNAPTNDAWITPWVNDLTNKGVTFFNNAEAKSVSFDGTNITGVTVDQSGAVSNISADYYLAAFPVEVARQILTPTLKPSAPSLGRIDKLKTEWMNGLQFYLGRDVEICHGHIILINSPWALTAISQPQFWPNVDMTQHGDGSIRGLISVDISDWTTPGSKTTTKRADQCTEAEIVAETWRQVEDHLMTTGSPLQPSDLKDHFLDPSIVPMMTNTQPLLVNIKNSWKDRPTAATEIPNLFLASDYVQTNTDLATMEGANEAARRAVNEILRVSNSNAAPCGVWPFAEPSPFRPLKEIDETFFDLGLPQPTLGFSQMVQSMKSFFGF
jgi:uncharacterized protein with NAD-binding domain and iron-sulfur cluster